MQNPFYVIWTYRMDKTSPKWKDEEEKGSAGESRGLTVFTFTLFLEFHKQKNLLHFHISASYNTKTA
jgi:hypothetical protein